MSGTKFSSLAFAVICLAALVSLNGSLRAAMPSATKSDKAQAGPVELTGATLAILHSKWNAGAISEEDLLFITAQQIQAEQHIWKAIDVRRAKNEAAKELKLFGPQGPAHGRKKIETSLPTPILTYEWSALASANDKRADAIKNLLLGLSSDASVIEADLKARGETKAIVELFVFARKEIDGREKDFAARNLTHVVRRLISDGTKAAPAQVKITQGLPEVAYDFEAKALRFVISEKSGKPVFNDGISLLEPEQKPKFVESLSPEATAERGRYFATALSNRALYFALRAMAPVDLYVKMPGGEHLGSGSNSGQQIQTELKNKSTGGAFAFDRDLSLGAIPMAEAEAESVMNALVLGAGLKAEIVFVPEGADAALTVSGSGRRPSNALRARLLHVNVIDKSGKLLTQLSAQSFKLPGQAAAESSVAEARAQDRRAAEISGRDIVGLRLGMPFQKAVAQVRSQIKGGIVVEYGKAPATPIPFRDFKGFTSADGQESIFLYRAGPNGMSVTAIARRLELPPKHDFGPTRNQLLEKYGAKPEMDHKRLIVWSASADYNLCRLNPSFVPMT